MIYTLCSKSAVLCLLMITIFLSGQLFLSGKNMKARKHFPLNPACLNTGKKLSEAEFSQPCRASETYTWEQFFESVLFHNEIYKQFDVTNYATDIRGWAQIQKTFTFYLELWNQKYPGERPVRIMEVGSFKGRSTIHMAEICERVVPKRRCSILAIDTWTGSAEHYDNGQFYFRSELKANGGILRLYETFLKNIKKTGFDNIIAPFRLPSLSAAHVLKCYNISADFIFIDADHEYNAVKQDLYIFHQLLTPGGIIFGDDWDPGWPGVQKAVTEFASENGFTLTHQIEPATWVILSNIDNYTKT